MAIVKGALSIAAFKKATTWGTPVAAVALDGIGFVSETLKADVGVSEDQQIEGSIQQRLGEPENRMFAGEISTAYRYEGLEPMTAMVFRTAGAPSTVDTTAKKHVFKLNNDGTGIFGTLAIDKGFEVHEFTTVKVTGLSLKLTKGQRAEITYRFIAHDMNINTSAGTNNNTTFASVTFPANREFSQFKHMVARINAQSGAGLGASDAVYLNGFTLDVDRADTTDDVTTQFGNRIDEPMHDDWTKIKVTLELSKYQDGTGGTNALFANSLVKTGQKLDVNLTGETLAGATTQKFAAVFYFNDLQFSGTPNVGGPGLTPWTLEGEAHRVLAIPTGFPAGYIDACTMEVYSQRATDALA